MAQSLAPLNRVVVTGIGAITSLGLTFEETWNNTLSGYSGVRKNEYSEFPNLPCKIAAKVMRSDNEYIIAQNDSINNNNPPHIDLFHAKDHILRQEAYYTDPNIQYALKASAEAISAAKLDEYLQNNDDSENNIIDRYRIGVSFASALGGLESFENDHINLNNDKYKKIGAYNVSNRVINTSSSAISLRYKLRGPNLASATACSASAHAIQRGLVGICDIMIVGGTEACIVPAFIAGLCRCKALATKYNDAPSKASRPWDMDRNGFVMGEGAAVLVLESEEMARQRGVSDIYGEIVGVGATADAYHCTGLDPSGAHVQKCMSLALESAVKHTGDHELVQKLGYINAHGTSTDIGDKTELKAILSLLEEEEYRDVSNLKISSTKSSIGHLMGASGAIESCLTLKALKSGMVPPTINLDKQDDFVPQNVNLVPNEAQELSDEFEYAMSNSFGFGGTNASIIYKKRNSL